MTDIPADFTTTATFEGNPYDMATFSGELETVGDVDWIKFTVDSVGPFGSVVFAFGCVDGALGGNSTIVLRDANGNLVNSNDNAPQGLNSFCSGSLLTAGTYYFDIRSADGWTGDYSLVLMGVTPFNFLGPADTDTLIGPGGVTVCGDGDDTVQVFGHPVGTPDNDLIGEQGDDILTGDGGRNRISGGLGNDQIDGREGDDLLFGDAGYDQISGNVGNDVIYGGAGHDRLLGDAGNDTIFAGPGSDQCLGGTGDDTFHVDSNDQVFESTGNGIDAILTSGNFSLAAGQEIENLSAETTTSTTALNLSGNEFANTITGNNGANILTGGGGSDVLQGLLGNDIYALVDDNDIVVDTGGIDTITSLTSRSLALYSDVENLTLTGLAAINGIGNGLTNTIIGNSAFNTLDGGAGDDNLNGGGSIDVLVGGAGNDTYNIDAAIDLVIEAAGAAGGTSDQVKFTGSAGQTLVLANNVEVLTLLGSAATHGKGNASNNRINGNLAANTLDGSGGNDVLSGNAGNDILIGGTGRDTSTGGIGNDIFRFNTAPNTLTNRDVITDFTNAAGNNDTIQLSDAVFTKLGAGGTRALDPAFFRAGAAAVDANDHIIYNKATGALFYDTNGNAAGGVIQIATLTNHAALTATDFVVL